MIQMAQELRWLGFIAKTMQEVMHSPCDSIPFLAVPGQVEQHELRQRTMSARVDAVDISAASATRRPRNKQHFQFTKQKCLCAPDVAAQDFDAPRRGTALR
jgi:hypothetical protein